MKQPLPPEELEIFRAAMAEVRRHPPTSRVSTQTARPTTRPRSLEADEQAVLDELWRGPFEPDPVDSVDALAYRGDGIQDSVWRRLRRGGYRIGAELDLHGYNRDRAYHAVAGFLADCQNRDLRCVRIIHGKGLGSPNTGPVIRSLLDGWLRRRKDVLAFCAARPHDGGTGAAYVLLRTQGGGTNQRR
ncbi:MAG TPA: Smr/MutS family protein [Castellaniella sp.]|uniref:Smr/MutS family protein n=1 Tax=Castellaniella sp. TaxID=1955812 RepID=UPI002F1AD67B